LFVFDDALFQRPWAEAQPATIGVNSSLPRLRVHHRRVALKRWETTGHEAFWSLAPFCHREAAGVVAVADLTNIDSFAELEFWLHEAREYCQGAPPCS
jgi:GTPase SAR1 family protein